MKKIELFERAIAEQAGSPVPTLAEFEKHGFRMAGLTEVKANYTDWQTQERAAIPAIRMELREA